MAFEDFWFSKTDEPTGASLRFSGAQYIGWTPAANGDRLKWTWSGWVKRGTVDSSQENIFGASGLGGPNSNGIRFSIVNNFSQQVSFETYYSAGADYAAVTDAVYRDPGAWYHIVAVWDSANAVSTDRQRTYVNGVRMSVTYPYVVAPINTQSVVNSTVLTTLGGDQSYLNGYLSDVFFVDGLALLPTDFGYFDGNGVWVPYEFATAKGNVVSAGGFGTNGFALRFESQYFNSGTLVWADQSGNGNNFLANWNCQVGAGGGTTGTDIVTDGLATNYATISPLYQGASTSNANLTTANVTGKPSILPAFVNSGTVPQIVGVNSAGVSWNGTEAGWTSTGNISFGQQSTFTAGTKLSAAGLNAVTIPNGSTGFQAVLDTGANILTTAQATFPNGLWWVKDRVNANQHQLVDSVRGAANAVFLPSNAAQAAYTAPTGNSVAWCWEASTAFSNPSGTNGATIASTGLTNAATGFSIVQWTSNSSADGRIYHNLGATPSFIIQRYASVATSQTLASYLSNAPGTYVTLNLNLNAAGSSGMIVAPTSTTFSNAGAGLGADMIGYLWTPIAGYSSFGEYTGNGSADGPFVYTGGKPAFVILKASSTGGASWEIYDNVRNTYNPETLTLSSDTTAAESTINGIDFLSNGFKIRTANANLNTSAVTYFYAAFAENPFGGSNVAPVTAR